MNTTILLATWVAAAGGDAEISPGARPSAAVFTLETTVGLPDGLAALLSDALTAHARASGAFGRVISSREVETAVGLERQRQMLDCKDDSCMAEIAGSLGVDLVLGGSVGRVGATSLLNLRLLNIRKATAVSISERVNGPDNDALVDALVPALARILREARLPFDEAALASADASSRAVPAQPAPATEQGGRGSVVPTLVTGAGGALLGVLALGVGVLGAAAVVSAVAGYAYTRGTYVDTSALVPREQHGAFVDGVVALVAGTGGLLGVASVLLLLAAGGVAVAAVVLGVR